MIEEVSQAQAIPQYSDNHYAVVDLGSNSFHLLITQLVSSPSGQQLRKVNKVKQKVRLAAGLDHNNMLTPDALARGLSCLEVFAQHLASIPNENILIVATAALRIAKNNQLFFQRARRILPKPIKLLTGEQEAKTIYAGMAHTHNNQQCSEKQLVIDIGGASTEIIIGEGCVAKKVDSLPIGCVSLLGKFFPDGVLALEHFNQCIVNAEKVINRVKAEYMQLGWKSAVGSSGTMQAMVEILTERQQAPIISLTLLNDIKTQLIQCETIDNINLPGLRSDRGAVLASGLCILIALFNCLHIQTLTLSSGALREGLLFELLPDARLI